MAYRDSRFYSPEMEYRKDQTPSTGAFVWFVPLFVVLALLGRTETPKHDSRTFSLQDSAFVCVMGQCL